MKMRVINLLVIFFAVLFLNGCYTVIWMPEDKFPSENTSSNYYDEFYYGDYYSFYDYPWWLRFSPPSTPVGIDYNRSNNETTSSIRNEGSGRSTSTDRKILETAPPSRDGSNNNSSTNTTKSSSDSNSSSTNSNNTRSSDSNSIRNNDGNRNTNSGRK